MISIGYELAALVAGYGFAEFCYRMGRWHTRRLLEDRDYLHDLERQRWFSEPAASPAPTQLEMNQRANPVATYQAERRSWQETVPHVGPVMMQQPAAYHGAGNGGVIWEHVAAAERKQAALAAQLQQQESRLALANAANMSDYYNILRNFPPVEELAQK